MNAYLEFIYIYIYIYCLYFNPLALNPSSVLAPSHMRRALYVRGATGRVLLLEYLINFLTCTYRSSWISILKEKKLINPTNHTCFKSIVNKAKPFFYFFYGLLLLLLRFQVRKTLPIIMSTRISTYIKEKSLHLHYSFCILLFILSLCILRIKEKSR